MSTRATLLARHGLGGWLRRVALWLIGAAVLVAAASGVAYGFWASTDSSNYAAAAADALPQGATPTATVTSATTVAVTYARAVSTSGRDVTSYTVNRYSSPTATTPAASFVCAWPSSTTLSCSDTNVPGGIWYYTDTPQIGGSLWAGAESARSSAGAVTDSTPPTVAVTSISPVPNGNGYNNSSPVTVNLSATDNTGGSGVASITYWVDSATPTTVANAAAAVTVTGNGTHIVSYFATDNAGNVSTTQTQTVKIDTIAPTVAVSTVTSPINAANQASTSASGTVAAGAPVAVTVVASDGVNSTAPVTATVTGTTWSTSGINTTSLNNGTVTYTATATDAAGNTATATATATKNTVAPTVTSIGLGGASPTNAASVSWTVTFSEPVTNVAAGDFAVANTGLTGTPAITAVAPTSGFNSTYTVTASTGAGSGTLGLNLTAAGTIQDAVGNPLATTTFTGAVYTINHVAPTVTSIALAGASPTNAASVSWTVTFSEPVTNVAAGDFAVANTGLTGTPAITAVAPASGLNSTYTVTASTGAGSGTLGLNLTAAGTIQDAVGNPLATTTFTGAVYTINHVAPTVTSIALAGASPTNAASVSWTVTFSEPVTNVAAGDFAVANTGLTGTPAITAVAPASGFNSTYTVTASTGAGSGTLGLNLTAAGTIQDAVGNPLATTTFTGAGYTIDHTALTVVSATSTGTGVMANGDTVSITFNKALNPSSVSTTGVTVTETRSGSGSSPTTLTIPNLFAASVTNLSAGYQTAKTTTTATGTATLSANHMTVTVTLSAVSGGSNALAGTGGFSVQALTTFTDLAGNTVAATPLANFSGLW